MATFQWINENEIESGYFWEVPASNPLVSLGVLEEWIPEPTWLAKTISRQVAETEDTWVWTKIAESFTGWIERIKEAWEGLANDKFTIPEAFVRGWAWALQSFLSPISWVLQEWVEEWVQALSDDFKKSVMETTAPTINSVVGWYQNQSPEQQRNLNNIGVWLEVLLEFVWGSAVKKPLQEIGWEIIGWTVQTAKTWAKALKEWVETITKKVSDIELPSLWNKPSEIAENIAWIDSQTKNVLKEVSTEDFDKYVQIGKQASENIKNPTPMDIAWEEALDALWDITRSKKSVGKEMWDIVDWNENVTVNTSELTNNYKDFLRDRFNLNIDPKTLKISTIKGKEAKTSDIWLIEKLNDDILSIITVDDIGIKNLDAIWTRIKSNFDKILNERGVWSNLSADEKSLKWFIWSEITWMIKKNLPERYAEISKRFAKLLDIETRLSKLLGDKWDKWASLIKSAYSPQTWARFRRLAEEIKEELGIDLMTKAWIAKFAMQLAGDSRQANLLQALDLWEWFTSKLSEKLQNIPIVWNLAELWEIGVKKIFPTEKVGRWLTK